MRLSFWALLLDPVCGLYANDRLDALRHDIEAVIGDQKATFGIAFRELGRGQHLMINADDIMHAASTMKVPVMMRLFQMVDHGELRLDQQIPLRNRFKSIVDGSTFEITVDSDEVLYKRIGQTASVEELITLMIIRSSNLATNILIEVADAGKVMALMGRLGIEEIHVRRGVEDLKAYDQGLNNQSSAGAMLEVMIAAVASPVFSETSRSRMLAILRQQEFNEIIPAGLPASARVAHKTGAISRVEHDAAIVDLADGTRYGLVIFARDFEDQRKRVQETGKQISELVYRYVVSPKVSQ